MFLSTFSNPHIISSITERTRATFGQPSSLIVPLPFHRGSGSGAGISIPTAYERVINTVINTLGGELSYLIRHPFLRLFDFASV